jgi:glutaconate CoA-transferase subunit A
MRPQLVSIEDAISSIREDACLAFGGFDIVRAPMSLVFELARRGKRRLELVSPPNPLAVDILIGAGIVRKATLAFSGFQHEDGFAVGPMWKKAVESGVIDFREIDAYAILCGLRAAAMGLPFLPVTDIDGSELRDLERWRQIEEPFSRKTITVTRPIKPDVALVHAQAADRAGNLYIEDPIIDELVAKASRRVIASVEEITDQDSRPTIPYYLVDSIVTVPRGAWPSACPGNYPADHGHIVQYLKMAEDGRFKEYYRRFVGKPQ